MVKLFLFLLAVAPDLEKRCSAGIEALWNDTTLETDTIIC